MKPAQTVWGHAGKGDRIALAIGCEAVGVEHKRAFDQKAVELTLYGHRLMKDLQVITWKSMAERGLIKLISLGIAQEGDI